MEANEFMGSIMINHEWKIIHFCEVTIGFDFHIPVCNDSSIAVVPYLMVLWQAVEFIE